MIADDEEETGPSPLKAAGFGAKVAEPEAPGGLIGAGGISGPGGLIGAGGTLADREEAVAGGAGGIIPVGAGGGPPAGGIEVEEIPTAMGFGGSFNGGSFMGAPGAGGTGGTLGLSVGGSLTT